MRLATLHGSTIAYLLNIKLFSWVDQRIPISADGNPCIVDPVALLCEEESRVIDVFDEAGRSYKMFANSPFVIVPSTVMFFDPIVHCLWVSRTG